MTTINRFLRTWRPSIWVEIAMITIVIFNLSMWLSLLALTLLENVLWP